MEPYKWQHLIGRLFFDCSIADSRTMYHYKDSFNYWYINVMVVSGRVIAFDVSSEFYFNELTYIAKQAGWHCSINSKGNSLEFYTGSFAGVFASLCAIDSSLFSCLSSILSQMFSSVSCNSGEANGVFKFNNRNSLGVCNAQQSL